MSEYFMSEGKWPSSNEAFGAPAPQSYRSGSVQSITALPGGKVRVVVDDNGKKGQIWLTASVNAASQISWRCTSPDIPDVAEVLVNCSYRE